MQQRLHGVPREDEEDSQGLQAQHDTASKPTCPCCKAILFMLLIQFASELFTESVGCAFEFVSQAIQEADVHHKML